MERDQSKQEQSPAAGKHEKRTKGNRKAWRGSARWFGGVLATAIAATLVTFFTSVPTRIANLISPSTSGIAFKETVNIPYQDDEGIIMATDRGALPGPRLVHLMGEGSSTASPGFLSGVKALGGVDVGALSVQLILTGQISQGIRILDIHPIILSRTAPLAGAFFYAPAQAGNADISMIYDLDAPVPVARQVVRYPSASQFKALYKTHPDLISWEIPGNPFFDTETITLARGEQQVISVRAQTVRYSAAFNLEVDYIVGSNSSDMRKLIVTDHGRPFRVTGLHMGAEPGTASYQEAFLFHGNFSLCEITDPGRISTTPNGPQATCISR